MKISSQALFLVSLFFCACQSPMEKGQFNLEEIHSIPEYYDGCICTFNQSLSQVDEGKFLLIEGWEGVKSQITSIKVGGQLEKLTLDQAHSEENSKQSIRKYSNPSFSITIENMHQKPDGYDDYIKSIKLIFQPKQGKSKTMQLIGRCVC